MGNQNSIPEETSNNQIKLKNRPSSRPNNRNIPTNPQNKNSNYNKQQLQQQLLNQARIQKKQSSQINYNQQQQLNKQYNQKYQNPQYQQQVQQYQGQQPQYQQQGQQYQGQQYQGHQQQGQQYKVQQQQQPQFQQHPYMKQNVSNGYASGIRDLEIIRDGKINLNNIGNYIDRFNEQEKDLYDKFTKEQERIKQHFINSQNKKRQNFDNELSSFESEFNPYQVLGIEMGSDINTIQKAYRKLSLKTHPDRGGDPDQFRIVTQAYCYLLKKNKKLNYKEQSVEELQENVNQFMEKQFERQNIHLDKDNFNINKFNDLFNKFKLSDINDDGYGNMMSKDNRLKEPDNPTENKETVFTENFNKNLFNKVFQEKKEEQQKKVSTELIKYDEPIALASGGYSFQELGQGKIDDFGREINTNGIGYTDYKRAHETDTTLINPDDVKYRKYKNIEELEKERSKITYKMSDKDKRKEILKKQELEKREEDRLRRLEEQDYRTTQQFESINKLFLKN